MKILITGASGLLGRKIKSVFDKEKWDVLGIGFTRLNGNLRKVNLQNEDEIVNIIDEYRPDVVVHAAAERNYGLIAKHENEAVQLNVMATEIIAKTVNKYGGFVLYISTNLVFDGTAAPYKCTDKTNPANKYGVTKLQGEEIVTKYCKKSAILRLPLLYGEVEDLKESGVSSLLAILQDVSKNVVISNYEQKHPTYTYDVGVVCKLIIQYYQEHENFHGTYHWSGKEKFTKYGMVKILSDIFHLSMSHIEPSEQAVGRHVQPYDCELDCSELERIGIICQTSPFEETVKECLQSFVK